MLDPQKGLTAEQGEAILEVLREINGLLFKLEDHAERLRGNVDARLAGIASAADRQLQATLRK